MSVKKKEFASKEDAQRYHYHWTHYLLGSLYIPGAVIGGIIVLQAIKQDLPLVVVFFIPLAAYNLYLISLFSTGVKTDGEFIHVTYNFIISRKIAWKNIEKMKVKRGNIQSCFLYSKNKLIPINIILGGNKGLKGKQNLMDVIKDRANLELSRTTKKYHDYC